MEEDAIVSKGELLQAALRSNGIGAKRSNGLVGRKVLEHQKLLVLYMHNEQALRAAVHRNRYIITSST
jgi:hypothetical protein